MAITMTESAESRVRTFLQNRGKGIGLRLGVKPPVVPVWLMYWSLLMY